jgi:UDP-glucose 4-epimerase
MWVAILVTGGAGYIGSVTVELLREAGAAVVVLDNLSRGHRRAVSSDVPFYQGSIDDAALVTRLVRDHQVDACIHFAAYAYVGESVSQPSLYFDNNVRQGIALLDALRGAGVRKLVFSSTCATYGEPQSIPISESHPQWPANPYGWSKLVLERVLEAYDRAYQFRFVSLRYFNAAGATTEHGEDHRPETHLIPLVLGAARGAIPHVSVFGCDYPTPDGTAIRDYIHVTDLGKAHILALEHLTRGEPSEFINLGTGRGYSVLEVINAARTVTGLPIETRTEPRRPGDPSRLVADCRKAKEVLGWLAAYSDLASVIRSAWEWSQGHPMGYEE